MPDRRTAKARLIEGAISRTLSSSAWAAAGDDTARARVLTAAVLEALDTYSPSALADAYSRVLRDREIREAFNGRNQQDLARRYGLDERQLRRIVHPRRK